MKAGSASTLALAAAAVRAIEAYRPDGERIFDDNISVGLLPPFWRGFVKLCGQQCLWISSLIRSSFLG